MSFWQRLRDSLRGPLKVEGMNDPEVEEDLAEEMPDAAEDARETADAEQAMTRGGVPLAAPLAPPTPTTIEFEQSKENAEASDQDS